MKEMQTYRSRKQIHHMYSWYHEHNYICTMQTSCHMEWKTCSGLFHNIWCTSREVSMSKHNTLVIASRMVKVDRKLWSESWCSTHSCEKKSTVQEVYFQVPKQLYGVQTMGNGKDMDNTKQHKGIHIKHKQYFRELRVSKMTRTLTTNG